MNPRLQAASAFGQTLGRTRPGLSRAAFYADASPRFDQLPATDKALVMGRFADFNRGQITAVQGWEALGSTGEFGGIAIGASTGTSGSRSLHAITQAERYRWLGTIPAKTLPAFLARPERVAIALPQASVLYEGVNRLRGWPCALMTCARGRRPGRRRWRPLRRPSSSPRSGCWAIWRRTLISPPVASMLPPRRSIRSTGW